MDNRTSKHEEPQCFNVAAAQQMHFIDILRMKSRQMRDHASNLEKLADNLSRFSFDQEQSEVLSNLFIKIPV